MPYHTNRRELAAIFGTSLVTITAWTVEGMPAVLRGRKGVAWVFNVPDCVDWKRARDVRLALGNDDADSTMAEAELRDARARAALRELDLAERRASVVPVEDAGAVLSEMACAVRSRFEGVAPARLGARVAGKTDSLAIQRAIEAEIDSGLRDLAKFEPTLLEAV